MKYYESTFEEYVKSVKKSNYHPELETHFGSSSSSSSSYSSCKNYIYYGPSGVGKYSQMLTQISRLSPTQLKYQKKMTVPTEKGDFSFLFSDIHYEIDMGLLGCNAKIIWDAVFNQILDMLSVKPVKFGILVCKNFHQIHSELLDIFFIYFKQFQTANNVLFNKNNIILKYAILTEHISFLPNTLIHSCQLISIARPTKQALFMGKSSNIRAVAASLDLETISNLKELNRLPSNNTPPVELFYKVCQPLLNILKKRGTLDLLKIRDHLYNISIYQLDFMECLWYFMSSSLQQQDMTSFLSSSIEINILQEIAIFLKYYNNNYRTIYHFESIYFSLYLFLKNRDNLVI